MKKSLLLTSSLILALGLTGCSNTSNTDTESSSVDIEFTQEETSMTSEEFYSQVKSLIESDNSILELPYIEMESINDLYFLSDIKDVILDGLVYRAAMNVHIQDVVIARTSDIDSVKNQFEDYLESRPVQTFGDGYGGDHNINSVKNAIIGTIDDYVYLIVAPNSDKIEKSILSLLKK